MANAARPEPEQVLDPAALARYADLLAVTCLALEPDDILFLAAHPEHRELLVALTEAAYRAGARLVDIAYDEPRAAAARVRYAADEHLGLLPDWQARRLRASKGPDRASLFVVGEADPGVFDGLPPERVAADSARRMQKIRDVALASLDGRIRWTACAWPTAYWAGQVYPGARDGRREATARGGHPLVLPARARTTRPTARAGSPTRRCSRSGRASSPSSG